MRFVSHIRTFMQLEAAGGIVLMAAAALAMLAANSPLASSYFAAKAARLGPMTLDHWISDGLMVLFFFLIGLELKREFIRGHLSHRAARVLPGLAAAAGVAMPAVIYLAVAEGHPDLARGWAVPCATDIAFALGVISLLGSRVPQGLKTFLVAVAVIDDLIAVAIIAAFYTSGLALMPLAAALGGLALLALLNRSGVARFWPYLVIGLGVWIAVLQSGIHPTLAGVAVAMTIPLGRDEEDGPLERAETALHPWVAFLVVPLFGFFNAGVPLGGLSANALIAPVPLGIAAGLFVGKQAGVLAMIALAVRLGWARLPHGASWPQTYGVALLCGIGFTMSLFIGGLAFRDPATMDLVRIGVLCGSLVSAIAGLLVLKWTSGVGLPE